MSLSGWLHEGPGPQASLHPQRVGAQSGVSPNYHIFGWLKLLQREYFLVKTLIKVSNLADNNSVKLDDLLANDFT